VVATGEIYYTWIFVAIAAVGIVLARKRYPLLIVSSAIFVLGMLPVLGLTRFMYQRHSTVADHYMYLPMLGVALAVAEVTAVSRSRRVDAIVVMLIIVMGGVSLMQERYWRDSIALFSRAAQVTPEDAGIQGNLGRALAQAGRVGEAVPHFEKAVTLSPADVEEQISLARALLLSGDAAAAEPHLAEAVRLSPDDPRLAAELTALRARLRPPATNKGDIPAY
jgi:tetratricopeptide (TPR) repeat protein